MLLRVTPGSFLAVRRIWARGIWVASVLVPIVRLNLQNAVTRDVR